jgi:hypothetical protein
MWLAESEGSKITLVIPQIGIPREAAACGALYPVKLEIV